MNRKLVMGAVAGVAAIGLAVGGTTYSAFSDYGDINNNTVGAGFLKLDLGSNGTGNAPFDYGRMAPGSYTGRQIWIASNDGDSVPTANLFITLHNLQDTAAPCSISNGKVAGENASGVTGCSIDPSGGIHGTPAQGNLSRVLSFQGYYYPSITSPAACAALTPNDYPSGRLSFFSSGRGDLNPAASGTGTKYELVDSSNKPLQFKPGQAGCIGISAGWVEGSDPASPSTSHPSDNSAQGDQMSFDAHFDLVQDITASVPAPVQGP